VDVWKKPPPITRVRETHHFPGSRDTGSRDTSLISASCWPFPIPARISSARGPAQAVVRSSSRTVHRPAAGRSGRKPIRAATSSLRGRHTPARGEAPGCPGMAVPCPIDAAYADCPLFRSSRRSLQSRPARHSSLSAGFATGRERPQSALRSVSRSYNRRDC
jgi:hypothetical protein